MPIVNLNLRAAKLPKLGDIRKGIKVPVMTQGKNPKPKKNTTTGEIVTRPKEVHYFVINVDPAEKEAAESINQIYGTQPIKINAFIAYHEIDKAWDCWLEAYTFNQLVARSDGAFVTYLFDTQTNQRLISYGTISEMPKDPESTAAQLIKGLGVGDVLAYSEGMIVAGTKEKPITFDAVGRLELVLPELKRLATFTLHTGGRYFDVPHITEMVSRVAEIAHSIDRPANLIPLTLTRVERERSYKDENGKAHRRKSWDIQIEISSKIFAGLLAAYEETPVALLAAAPPPALPEPDLNDNLERPYLVETVSSAPSVDDEEDFDMISDSNRPPPPDGLEREAQEAIQNRQAAKAKGQITKVDSVLLEKLVKEKIFASLFAAENVMKHCAWFVSTVEKYFAWAKVYREWKKHFETEGWDPKEATAEAIKQTNAGKRVGEN